MFRLTEEDVDAYERNQSALCRQILDTCASTNASDDELTDGHTDGTKEQQRTTSPCFHHPETGEGRADIDSTGDHADYKGILDARVCEEGGAVVELKTQC